MSILTIRHSLKFYTFMLFASAILGTNFFAIDIGIFKLSIYRILLLCSPFLFLYIPKSRKENLSKQSNNQYFTFLTFWVVYSILGVIWIKDFSGFGRIFYFLISGCITSWFIGWYFTNTKDIINALKVIENFAIFFGLLAIYEILTGNYFTVEERVLQYYQERSVFNSTIGYRIPASVFGNPNNYALFLLFSITGSLCLSKIKKTKLSKLKSLISVGFFIFLLIATQSRSGLIGLTIGILMYMVFTFRIKSIAGVLKFLLALLVLIILLFPWFFKNKDLFDALLLIDTSLGSDAIRVNLIKNGFIFLTDSFFMGVGLGNIEYYMSTKAIYPTMGLVNMHNWWMEILVSSGIIVFAYYIYVYIKYLKKLLRFSIRSKFKEYKHVSIYFFCFLSAFIIASFGASSIISNEWLWPIIALIISYANILSSLELTLNFK